MPDVSSRETLRMEVCHLCVLAWSFTRRLNVLSLLSTLRVPKRLRAVAYFIEDLMEGWKSLERFMTGSHLEKSKIEVMRWVTVPIYDPNPS